MRNIIFIITMLSCSVVLGQQKKSKKALFEVPKIKRDVSIESSPPPPPAPGSTSISETENCFVFRQEEPKDSLVYVTENLLEYRRNGNIAQMIISSSNYDPIKKLEAEKDGMMLARAEKLQFIDGTYRIVKGILTFTPINTEKNKSRTFKIVLKPKTLKVDYLWDENNNKYNKGQCHEKTMSIGM